MTINHGTLRGPEMNGIAWADVSAEAWTALGIAVAGIGTAIAYLIKGYLPYRIQVKKIDSVSKIKEYENALQILQQNIRDREQLVDQLSNSLEGMYLLAEEYNRDHDDCQGTCKFLYQLIKQQHRTIEVMGGGPDPLPQLPEPRARNVEKIARAKFLVGEGRQAKAMIDDSLARDRDADTNAGIIDRRRRSGNQQDAGDMVE